MGWQTDGLLCNAAPYEVTEALSEILNDPQWERRRENRVPFFGPVSVSLADASGASLSAFARDISLGGIGLVHLMPLPPGEVLIGVTLPSGRCISLRTYVAWCRDYGDGWYASGGRFLGVSSPTDASSD
jgi:hypothetical protein